MGYNTEFEGKIDITPALTAEELAMISDFADKRHEDNTGYGRRGADAPSYYCDWEFSRNGTSLFWDGGEKSYEMDTWLEILIRKLPGHEFNGTLRARGEEFHDMWSLTAKGRTVTRTMGW